MSLFKKIFGGGTKEPLKEVQKEHTKELSLDDSFVHNFIDKGGKFLYSTSILEVEKNLRQIMLENNWDEVICTDYDLHKILKKTGVNIQSTLNNSKPFFTACEHLIADSGELLFSSNQLQSIKINELSDDFIVYATTSQLVKNKGEGLTGIKTNYKGNIPTNISSIKKYTLEKSDDFLNYGNSNSKNLYLLLFEDL